MRSGRARSAARRRMVRGGRSQDTPRRRMHPAPCTGTAASPSAGSRGRAGRPCRGAVARRGRSGCAVAAAAAVSDGTCQKWPDALRCAVRCRMQWVGPPHCAMPRRPCLWTLHTTAHHGQCLWTLHACCAVHRVGRVATCRAVQRGQCLWTLHAAAHCMHVATCHAAAQCGQCLWTLHVAAQRGAQVVVHCPSWRARLPNRDAAGVVAMQRARIFFSCAAQPPRPN